MTWFEIPFLLKFKTSALVNTFRMKGSVFMRALFVSALILLKKLSQKIASLKYRGYELTTRHSPWGGEVQFWPSCWYRGLTLWKHQKVEIIAAVRISVSSIWPQKVSNSLGGSQILIYFIKIKTFLTSIGTSYYGISCRL